ncbi:O-antigen ligase [Schumannella sp. 10F1B-5-1]|uniref:O-antigen ligase family protein n=1 Tax=Schumannella sp. 10F1B-5-1 TaxID=2590780 RepID=UPI0011322E36|nr:O-antigen ligase family protein [Schumannella sp. 10F1B-5-1]TPW73566.1 O-antigen ligase family protein [Schumannella sp. 10F1B-5-1]
MTLSSRYHRALAASAFFTGLAGDVFRYAIGWAGWGVVVGLIVALCVVELVRHRMRLDPVPVMLVLFLGVCAASTAWSAYPALTGLATVVTVAAVAVGLFVASALDWTGVITALADAGRAILALSLLFELVVAVFVRQKVLPFFSLCDLSGDIPRACYWSRDLLFQGGRIQGIQGNSNLLAIAALLALIAFAVQLAAGLVGRTVGVVWIAVAVLTLALTRSSTVIVAGLAAAVVLAVVLVIRRTRGVGRTIAYAVSAGVVVLGVVGALVFRGPLLALLGKSSDLTNRGVIWSKVIELAQQRPVGGWGWITYWFPGVHPFDSDAFLIKGVRYSQAHDAWLDLWLQVGIVGLVLFATFALGLLIRSWLSAIDTRRGDETVGGDPALVGTAARSRRDAALAIAPLLFAVVLLVQSLAESRILIEGEFMLLVVVAIATRSRDLRTFRWLRRGERGL